MRNFFEKSKTLEVIQAKLLEQQDTINSYLSKLDDSSRYNFEWCTVRGMECKSTGLLMWEKDLKHRYTFVNSRHCNDFYQTSMANVRKIIGKTDDELIPEFIKRTGLDNTFAGTCVMTDQFVLDNKTSCRFWELGYIGDKIVILDITKQPLYNVNKKLIGTRSWAIDNSRIECEVHALLKLFLQTGEAIRLDTNSNKKIAAYLIKKNVNPFNGVFPK